MMKVKSKLQVNQKLVKEKASADEANEIKAKFEEAGASIELK